MGTVGRTSCRTSPSVTGSRRKHWRTRLARARLCRNRETWRRMASRRRSGCARSPRGTVGTVSDASLHAASTSVRSPAVSGKDHGRCLRRKVHRRIRASPPPSAVPSARPALLSSLARGAELRTPQRRPNRQSGPGRPIVPRSTEGFSAMPAMPAPQSTLGGP